MPLDVMSELSSVYCFCEITNSTQILTLKNSENRFLTTPYPFFCRSPISERYRETTIPRDRRPKGQESYTRKAMPRPKSLFMETTDVSQLKKYRSVVTLQSDNSYQQRYVPSRSSPTKATISPTHERVQRRRLNSQDEFLPLMTSEYYSVTHSSDSDNAWNIYIQF